MKFTLFGSTPSAIYATLTPAPVNPSERAVNACGSSDAVCVTCSASGSSSTWPWGRQAPGMLWRGGDGIGVDEDAAVAAAVRGVRRISTSGSTRSTAGWVFSISRSLSDTFVANALTTWNDLTVRAWVWFSVPISGAWSRVAASSVTWFFMMMITARSTVGDHAGASDALAVTTDVSAAEPTQLARKIAKDFFM